MNMIPCLITESYITQSTGFCQHELFYLSNSMSNKILRCILVIIAKTWMLCYLLMVCHRHFRYSKHLICLIKNLIPWLLIEKLRIRCYDSHQDQRATNFHLRSENLYRQYHWTFQLISYKIRSFLFQIPQLQKVLPFRSSPC